VLTVIDKEEVNYLMSEPRTEVQAAESVNYSVYTNAKGIECLTCESCKHYLVKGWCGKELCSTRVVGEDDESVSSDDSPMPPLQRRKGKQWIDPGESDEDDDESYEDTKEQDIALVVNDSSNEQMLDHLPHVATEKGIREPNIDSWASSVEDKLSKIDLKTPRDVVSNIITINGSLQDYGRSMLHDKTLDLLARVGVEIICPQDVDQMATALTAFENQVTVTMILRITEKWASSMTGLAKTTGLKIAKKAMTITTKKISNTVSCRRLQAATKRMQTPG
jgi:hypothetical protein